MLVFVSTKNRICDETVFLALDLLIDQCKFLVICDNKHKKFCIS